MLRAGGDRVGDRIAFRIGGGDGAGDRGVMGDGERGVRAGGNGRAGVRRGDVDDLRGGAAVAVGDLERKAVGADIIGGGVGVMAVGVGEGHRAVLRAGGDRVAQSVAVGVRGGYRTCDRALVCDRQRRSARLRIDHRRNVIDHKVQELNVFNLQIA